MLVFILTAAIFTIGLIIMLFDSIRVSSRFKKDAIRIKASEKY